jgi:hypothetical protein
MSEQDLKHANVDMLLEQVRGEAVSQRVSLARPLSGDLRHLGTSTSIRRTSEPCAAITPL